ncbi:MAG: STAS domain-containing protein [Betaproteobacteria bacterium]|nr:STAS domain-containing protein [Betaproteobacteria bacterium]
MAYTPVRLTMHDADAALAQGISAIAAGETEFDLGALQGFDSAAIAVLLAWQRAAHEAGKTLHISRLPPGLASLATLYGVGRLLPLLCKPNCPW